MANMSSIYLLVVRFEDMMGIDGEIDIYVCVCDFHFSCPKQQPVNHESRISVQQSEQLPLLYLPSGGGCLTCLYTRGKGGTV